MFSLSLVRILKLSLLPDDCVEDRRLLTFASWSARTSSRRTSESDILGLESSVLRISMNLEDMSRIVNRSSSSRNGRTGKDRKNGL